MNHYLLLIFRSLALFFTLVSCIFTFLIFSDSFFGIEFYQYKNLYQFLPRQNTLEFIENILQPIAPHFYRSEGEMGIRLPSNDPFSAQDWTSLEVADFIEDLFQRTPSSEGLNYTQFYRDLFLSEGIDGFLFFSLEDENLKDMNITNSLHRKKIFSGIKRLKENVFKNQNSDFWDLRATSKSETEILASGLIFTPRISLFYLYQKRYDTYLKPIFGNFNLFHWLGLIFAPNLLCSYYSLQFYTINRWVVPVFIFLSLKNFYQEYLLIATRSTLALKNVILGNSFTLFQFLLSEILPSEVMSFIFYTCFLSSTFYMFFSIFSSLLWLKKNHQKFLKKYEDDFISSKKAEDEDKIILKNQSLNMDLSKLNTYKIPYSELQFEQELGKGYFGEVYSAKWNGTRVAVKRIYRSSFKKDSQIALFYKELAILSEVRFPHCTMLLGYSLNLETRAIVLEYLGGGDLHTHLLKNWKNLEGNYNILGKFVFDISKGLRYLHAKKIIHRDLTCRNLLLDEKGTIKIADFGLSKILDGNSGQMTKQMGSVAFQAPEVYQGKSQYDEKCDIWSLGMVSYQIFTNSEPNGGYEPTKFAQKVAYENFRPSLNSIKEPNWVDFIQQCWKTTPNERPDASQLFHFMHQFGVCETVQILEGNFQDTCGSSYEYSEDENIKEYQQKEKEEVLQYKGYEEEEEVVQYKGYQEEEEKEEVLQYKGYEEEEEEVEVLQDKGYKEQEKVVLFKEYQD